MATLYITECAYIATTAFAGDVAQAPSMPPIAEQHLTINTTVASAAFNAATRFIMVNADAACSLAFSADGTDPTAVVTAHRMGANETRFYGVNPGGKIAVVANS